jgi:hypothetical protein
LQKINFKWRFHFLTPSVPGKQQSPATLVPFPLSTGWIPSSQARFIMLEALSQLEHARMKKAKGEKSWR